MDDGSWFWPGGWFWSGGFLWGDGWGGRYDCGTHGRWGSLHGEIVDYGLDAGDLSGVGCGEGARCFAADVAVEGGDTALHGGVDGLGFEGVVAEDAALYGCGETDVVGGSGGGGTLAAGQAESEG